MSNDVEREFLDKLIEEEKACRIYLVRGFQMLGKILKQDDNVILVKVDGESKTKIIYKQAISTIEEV